MRPNTLKKFRRCTKKWTNLFARSAKPQVTGGTCIAHFLPFLDFSGQMLASDFDRRRGGIGRRAGLKIHSHARWREAGCRNVADRLDNQDLNRSLKKAAYKVIPQCYMAVSDDGKLPANKRQIYYAVRPLVLEATGRTWKESETFTQNVLPDFLKDYPEETRDWDIVADARGHFSEPHVQKRIGIGTLEVRGYTKSWNENPDLEIKIEDIVPTSGPHNRYKFALFIEKEGFDSLLERAKIAERYDPAIFSSKGQTNVATRQLADDLSAAGVTILDLHDFDVAGFSIVHWLSHDNEKYTFRNNPTVIDLGLRLADVEAMGLESEEQIHLQRKDPTEKFWDWDDDPVTEEEANFLKGEYSYQALGWVGQRVELNAMTSAQFVTWLEDKLHEVGVEKVVPDPALLKKAWKRATAIAKAREAIREIEKGKPTPPPKDLEAKVRRMLKRDPEQSWDSAVVKIAEEHNR